MNLDVIPICMTKGPLFIYNKTGFLFYWSLRCCKMFSSQLNISMIYIFTINRDVFSCYICLYYTMHVSNDYNILIINIRFSYDRFKFYLKTSCIYIGTMGKNQPMIYIHLNLTTHFIPIYTLAHFNDCYMLVQ